MCRDVVETRNLDLLKPHTTLQRLYIERQDMYTSLDLSEFQIFLRVERSNLISMHDLQTWIPRKK